MKLTIYLLIFLILAGCGPSHPTQQAAPAPDTTSTAGTVENRRQLSEPISADFNGDGTLDQAFYKKENETSGIIIHHGATDEAIRIGFGQPFAHLTEFNWVDYWELVEDSIAYETTFTPGGDVLGSKEVKLQHPSIFIGADEAGGGLITFRNGKYEWVHQAD